MDTHQNGMDRRKHPRMDLRFTTKVRLKNSTDSTWQLTQLKNISVGGCFFVSGICYPVGSLLDIEMQIPQLDGRMVFVGEVKRVDQNDFDTFPIHGTAVQFVSYDVDKKNSFMEAINFFLNKDKRHH